MSTKLPEIYIMYVDHSISYDTQYLFDRAEYGYPHFVCKAQFTYYAKRIFFFNIVGLKRNI